MKDEKDYGWNIEDNLMLVFEVGRVNYRILKVEEVICILVNGNNSKILPITFKQGVNIHLLPII